MDIVVAPGPGRITGRGAWYGLLSGATIGSLAMIELALAAGTPAATVVYTPFAAVVGGIAGAILGAIAATAVAAVAATGPLAPATAAWISGGVSAFGTSAAALVFGGYAGWPPPHLVVWWAAVCLAGTAAGALSGPALVAPDRSFAASARRFDAAAAAGRASLGSSPGPGR